MEQEIKIEGSINFTDDVVDDEVEDMFIEFIEKNKWYFGGGFTSSKLLIVIDGCVSSESKIDYNQFIRMFDSFVNSKAWTFNGSIKEIIDGYYLNEDGSKGKYALEYFEREK